MLDFKICSHLCGEGHCCKNCHEGELLNDGKESLTFMWENSPVCCEAWIFLEERRENEKEAKH